MAVFCLALHSTWRCQHAGACCKAGWAIPVEGPAFETLRVHYAGRLTSRPLFVTGGPLPEGAAAILERQHDGTCVFYEGWLCTIHRELGPHAMPIACQQFPRIALLDRRGTFVKLSHFCPTAAGLLLTSGTLDVVEAPATLALNGELEGLHATDALPPLLRPGVLTDPEGYAEWERSGLRVLACGTAPVEEAIERIGAATEIVARWNPEDGPLREAARAAFGRGIAPATATAEDARRFELAVSAVPRGLSAPEVPLDVERAWADVSQWWPAYDRVARLFVATHLFANWLAYYGTGLATVVESLRVCLSVLKIELAREQRQAPHASRERRVTEAIRRSDLLLVHLADARALARAIEGDARGY